MLDAMDVVIYVFALQALRSEFSLTNAQAGLAPSLTLLSSALGGILAGLLADRFGRARTLVWTILCYSFASLGTAFAHSLAALLFWRAVIGIGLGGEWSAGAVLVAETWPAPTRSRAVGFMQSGWALGYLLAALLSAVILPRWGWRALFAVGVVPALLALWIRKSVSEPPVWRGISKQNIRYMSVFRQPLLRRTTIAALLMATVLCGYWGLFTWLPGFLSAPLSKGGAGLSLVRTSVFIVPTQIGAFLGYVAFGFIADYLGRRRTFVLYVLVAAVLTSFYGHARSPGALLSLGPLIGFFGSGFFSLFGRLLGELYPTAVRATGQGITYNAGRAMSALAPFLIGWLADRYGLGTALAVNAGFFALGALLIFGLPWRELELA